MADISRLRKELTSNRLLMDGAMGTMIQTYNLTEEDFRGERFRNWKVNLKGNNDVLVLTRPDVILDIHRRYVEAGADIVLTNTFSAQSISQQEYIMSDMVENINREAVRLARMSGTRFVLGDIGPTNRMLSMSDDVNNPAARAMTFDEFHDAIYAQMRVFMEEGVDGIMLETNFDTLNVKAALLCFEELRPLNPEAELFVSMTISDASGRSLSGQTVEAFVVSVAHAHPLVIGMNCGLGAAGLVPYIKRMKAEARQIGLDSHISCYPNAGLPDEFGHYNDTPEKMAREIDMMLNDGCVDIIGGCCGTTPEHISAFRKLISYSTLPEQKDNTKFKDSDTSVLNLSGLEAFSYSHSDFITVGERCNVAGSRKFLRLIQNKQYEEALVIAHSQIEKGAQVIDINMDDGMLDARQEMTTFLNLLASDPAICRVPLMIDSSRFDVIEAALKCCQGRCIVNSISLKQGEEEFLRQARIIRSLGAAVIVMLFDEEGQATDYDHRIHIAERAYRLLTEKAGYRANDIIFDPNILTIATGMDEHANYALDFIRATEWIHQNLPGTRISGGLSNLSFAFRGNNAVREAMHAVFIHYARERGMDMAIMNPATAVQYEKIDPELREAIGDVILNRRDDATERLTLLASEIKAKADAAKTESNTIVQGTKSKQASYTPEHSLSDALLNGNAESLDSDIHKLLDKGLTPLQIISGPLMEGMNRVGKLFGEGQMFLPQVVKTARTMKAAVAILEPYMEKDSRQNVSRGKVLTATVKGDVHDIGKNIVSVVMTCNGFEVIDLGVMVPRERIVEEAIRQKVDFVTLSGLITPSLEEMCRVAEAMQQAGLRIPLLIGGATTSEIHTAVRVAPLYQGGVYHMRDASQNAVACAALADPMLRDDFVQRNRNRQQRIRLAQRRKTENIALTMASERNPENRRFSPDWDSYSPVRPPFMGQSELMHVPVQELQELIDWNFLFWAWRVKADSDEGRMLKEDARKVLSRMTDEGGYEPRTIQMFHEAQGTMDSIIVGDVTIPTPRQKAIRRNGEKRTQCLSLCDFVSPHGTDYIGAFAATMSEKYVRELEEMKASSADDYDTLLFQTLGDRLAEATSVWLSNKLAKRGWHGIRPAVGYPALPDQKTMFILARLLDFNAVGISLTENGAMFPQASVSGLYIQHPEARYFEI